MAYQEEQKQEHIRELQRYLHGISYFNPAVPHLVASGVYGKETAAAVRSFQQQYGLHPTGETNRATWDAIVQQYQLLVTRPAAKLTVFSGQLEPGDTGFAVYIIQAILESLRLLYDNLPSVPVTGRYSEETRQAVLRFQQESGLRPTGLLDRSTWNLLAAAANAM